MFICFLCFYEFQGWFGECESGLEGCGSSALSLREIEWEKEREGREVCWTFCNTRKHV